MTKLSIRVFEKETNKDVTDERDWYIGTDGTLYFETSDVDSPLMEEENCYYELRLI